MDSAKLASRMENAAQQPVDLSRRRRIWPIVVAGLSIALVLGIYGCYRAGRAGQVQANGLGATLHDQMRAQDFGGIYSGASAAYQKAESRADSDALFAGIYRKLGAPAESKQLYVYISATTDGKIISAIFSTRFSKNAVARETIRWRKEQGSYRLLSYNINSKALLTR